MEIPKTMISNSNYIGERSNLSRFVTEEMQQVSEPQHRRLDVLFSRQVVRTPRAAALVRDDAVMTYLELDARSNRMGHHLRSMGVGRGVIVGVCLPRTFDMVVVLLGILKAGGAYLPLDHRHPIRRLAYMVDECGAALLITHQGYLSGAADAGRTHDLAALTEAAAAAPETRLAPVGDAEDLAYVIYTSGSTGAPKGVMLAHTATGLIEWARETLTSQDLARVAATTPLGFDPSVFEIFAPLALGGAVVVKSGPFEPFSAIERPTMLGGSPPVLSRLARQRGIPDSVRVVNLGGDVARANLVDELYRTTRVARVFNHYGPTEASTCTTVAFVPPGMAGDPTLGHPIPGATVHLLDADGQRVPIGATGEIHISGRLLALGYVNRPDLTSERFVVDPFVGRGAHMYRTGDLARWTSSGDLAFVGRADNQVKIHGVRIELGEIENALSRLPGVRQAVVLVVEDRHAARHLVAYVEGNETLAGAELRRGLAAWLPDHMIPARYVIMTRLPLTVAGKVDRHALSRMRPRLGGTVMMLLRAGIARIQSISDRHTPAGPDPAVAPAVRRAWARALQTGAAHADPDARWNESGGNSMRSVDLLFRLEQALGRKLAFDLISPEMTQRELTRRLRAPPADADPAAPRLFLVPGILGDEPSLSEFRRAFDGKVAFETVEAPRVDAPRALLESMRDTGIQVGREIDRRQPHGPILLGGFSFGGAVAFEAARYLVSIGRGVGLLLILDTIIPFAPDDPTAAPDADHERTWRRGVVLALTGSDTGRRAITACMRRLGHATSERMHRRMIRPFRNTAMMQWRSTPLAVPAMVVVSAQSGPRMRARWAQLAPDAAIMDITGGHRELFASQEMGAVRTAVIDAVGRTIATEEDHGFRQAAE